MPYTAVFRESPIVVLTWHPGGRDGSTASRVGARVAAVSHPEPGTVVVRTLAEHPLVEAGSSALRMVAPGSETAGRFGLVEYRLAPHSPGAAPHYHQTFSESFYVVSGELTVYADGAWRPYSAGDFALVHERGVHGFRNDGDEPADFLILFAPGIARGAVLREMASCGAPGGRRHRRR
jgi:quercetin dioxygenase-like cupin family protein